MLTRNFVFSRARVDGRIGIALAPAIMVAGEKAGQLFV
jgi:hypothetical protein